MNTEIDQNEGRLPFNPFEFCDAVFRAPNGAIVRHNARELCDLDELARWVEAHPEQVSPLPIDLASLKLSLRSQVESDIPGRRKAGFVHEGTVYQADPGVTEAVNGVLTALGAGVPVPFPLPWRSGDNQRPAWISPESFTIFAGQILAFVNGLYQAAWDAKDAIDAASTPEDAQAAYDAWKNQ